VANYGQMTFKKAAKNHQKLLMQTQLLDQLQHKEVHKDGS
jgi:hypothetical protein